MGGVVRLMIEIWEEWAARCDGLGGEWSARCDGSGRSGQLHERDKGGQLDVMDRGGVVSYMREIREDS